MISVGSSSKILMEKDQCASSPSTTAVANDAPAIRDAQVAIAFQERSQRLAQQINEASVRAHVSHGKSALGQGQVVEINADELANDLKQAGETKALETDVHVVNLDKLLSRLNTNSLRGLRSQQVEGIRESSGSNVLSPPPQKSYIMLFLEQLVSGFSFILWLAAIVIFISWKPLGELNGMQPQLINLIVSMVLVGVILISAIFNFWQELRSMAIIKAFSHIIPSSARVIRDNVEKVIPADELVVGDIVKLSMGDKVPADIRIIESSDLQVNNSALTGESEAVTLGTACTSLNYMESSNLAFYSALIVQGSGLGVVTSVGDNTVLGQVSRLTQANNSADTSLHREIRRFVLIISCISFCAGSTFLIVWGAWLYQDHPTFMPPASIVMNAFSLIVAFVPEGLPVCVTLTLTLIAKRMFKQRVLVKNLAIIETFNSVSIICSDKTGTLTQNLMTIVGVYWGAQRSWKPSAGNLPEGENASSAWSSLPCKDDMVFTDMIEGAILCNNAEQQLLTDDIGNESMSLMGDAVDVALYKMLRDKLAINVQARRLTVPRVKVLPFNSRLKLMVSMNERADGSAVCYMKGAPDIVINHCSHIMVESETVPGEMTSCAMTPELKAMVAERQLKLGEQGLRVICLARRGLTMREWKGRENDLGPVEFGHLPASNYTLIGLWALMDPPRDSVIESVAKCRAAGIRVAVVSGDHPSTVTSIARQVGIISEKNVPHIRTLKAVEDEVHRPIMQIYEGDKLIESHVIGTHPEHSSVRIPSAVSRAAFSSKTSTTENHNQTLNFRQRVLSYWHSWFGVASVSDSEARGPYVDGALVITGSDINLFDDYLWSWALQHREICIARSSPEQKLRLVSELQARHEQNCMTGDGVNDAPALKSADIGAALASGATVAHESADLILLNNDFTSLVAAIETGRLASDNLKKVCLYLLPGSTWSEMWPVLFNVMLGVPLSLSTFEMIVLSVLTDVIDALALVQEKAELSIMQRPPVDRRFSHMVDWRLLFQAYFQLGTICSFCAWFNYLMYFKKEGIPTSSVFFAWTWLAESCCPDGETCLTDDGNCFHAGGRIFTADEQNRINYTGQSIFFVSLVITNFFNMLSTRTRYESFFQHNPFYGRSRNLWLFVAIIASSLIAIGLTQITVFNDVFLTRPVPVADVAPALGFGFGLFLYDEARKWNLRNRPDSLWAKISW